MARFAGDDGAHQIAQLMLFIAKVARAAAKGAEANLCRHHDVTWAFVHPTYGS
jgi:hypothetical protein